MSADNLIGLQVAHNPTKIVDHRLRLPFVLWYLLCACIGFSLLSENPLLSCIAIGILPVLAKLTWRLGEPPVLFFAVFFQWVQVSLAIFRSNIVGQHISELPNVKGTETAVWFSLAGLVALAFGMKIGVGWSSRFFRDDKYSNVIRFSQKKIWYGYLVLFVLAAVVPFFLWQLPQLRTIVLALLPLKWVAFFVIAHLSFDRNKGMHNRYLIPAIMLEVLFGFSGYFSGFKHVFFVLSIAFLAVKVRIKNKDIVLVSSLVVIVLFLSVCWTSIKIDYRKFLNQGTGQQVVLVPFMQRIQVVANMCSNLDLERFCDGADRLVRRIAYVEMFARVLDSVPRYMPYENGKLWWSGIKHISMPRLFFPNKPALPSDSELTIKYTRTHWASGDQGASISMGYMAESYIDFGPIGMFVPIFLCGLLWGLMYRYFMKKVPCRIIAYGMVTALLINANQFEIHSVKLLGGMIMNFLVFAVVVKFILPKYLVDWSVRS